ncbi:receptor super member 5 [Branchiostoma belcheri]|nr:receptor super member 5 [Branchiostoma belcheri]
MTERCDPCPPVCDKPNMVTTFRGNTTHDAVCGCEVSYHLERGSCERNVYCERGEGIVENGMRCEPCTNGTYSDKLSDVEPCLPWTNCSKYGMDIAEEGTASSDRVCYGQSTEEPTSATPFVTVTIMTGTTAAMPEIKVIIQPTTNTLIVVVLPVVSTVLGFLACVGIYFLVTLKGCKIFWKKRLQHYHMESPDNNAEEAILVQGGSNPVTVEDLDMRSSVECEEDSISTNPKEKEASFSSHTQEDSQRLLHFVDSQITLPTLLPAQLTNFTVMNNPAYVSYADEQDGHENEEPVAEESSHREQSSPREIPPASPEEPLVSPSTLASSRETSASSLAYREEGVDLVLGVYSKELTNRQMEQLAAEIGNDWAYLAERLGLERCEVDHALNDYKGDMREQVRMLLQERTQ